MRATFSIMSAFWLGSLFVIFSNPEAVGKFIGTVYGTMISTLLGG